MDLAREVNRLMLQVNEKESKLTEYRERVADDAIRIRDLQKLLTAAAEIFYAVDDMDKTTSMLEWLKKFHGN